ncbi:fibroblast growth factor 9-like [Glandiceps talaboti]
MKIFNYSFILQNMNFKFCTTVIFLTRFFLDSGASPIGASRPDRQIDTPYTYKLLCETAWFMVVKDGGIRVTRKVNSAGYFEISSAGVGLVSIRESASGKYLKMDEDGDVSLSETIDNACKFKENLYQKSFRTFASLLHNDYLSVTRNGAIRGTHDNKRKRTHFIAVPQMSL